MGNSQGSKGQLPWIGAAIQAGQKYHIKHKSPLLHNAINLGIAGCLSLLITGLCWSGSWLPTAPYLCLAPLAFGLLYFALFILVVHEASHGMFVTLRNKRWAHRLNRAAGTVVAVFFATNYAKHWEVGHLEHHVRPLEAGDPQQHNNLVGRPLLIRTACCLLLPGFLLVERTLMRTKKRGGTSSSSKTTMVWFVLLWTGVLVAVATQVSKSSALAMVLGIHVIVALNHIKGSLEHGGSLVENSNSYLRSRSTFFFGRWLLMPFNITLHFEHHLNYRVPWYHLVQYHWDLQNIVPNAIASSVWNHEPLSQLRGRLGPVP